MSDVEEHLATIGFARQRCASVCWRIERLRSPVLPIGAAQGTREPAFSRALRRWRALLARDSRPSPYVVSRVARPPSARKA